MAVMVAATNNLRISLNSNLTDLMAHQSAVPDSLTVLEVYDFFQKVTHEFVAVKRGDNKLAGLVSRGQIGFLLGARFGVAVYGRQPILRHLLKHHLAFRLDSPILTVFEAALCRPEDCFHDDVVLLDEAENFLGLIPVRTLAHLQSQMILEQIRLSDLQQRELLDKNRQLFRTVNELNQSRGRFDILFENSALGVALLNREGEIETCNRRLETVLNFPAFPVVSASKNPADLMSDGDRQKFLHLLAALERHSTESANSAEFTLAVPGKGLRLFKFFLNWIQETGQICAVLEDIGEQRALERRMQQKEKAALLESLAGGIAHEINNKLSPIIGYSDLLAAEVRRFHRGNELEKYCDIIRDSALDSAKIIRQLLQLSRPHKMEMTRCDLKQLVQDAVNLLRFRLRNVDCQVIISQPREDCFLMADATQIKQLVMNLVLNAGDALEGQPHRQLGLRILRDVTQLQLLVSDTGHGIQPEHLGRIFDPFFTTKTAERGTGLGLSVCYSIAKQHGGEISVESTCGKGTTFQVTLPVGELPELAELAAQSGPGPANGFFHARKVLIVDDEEFVSGMIQEALKRKLGCQIDKALDGHRAIEKLRRNHYDMVISDVRMPVLDGFGLLEWVRTHQPQLLPNFIFITGDPGSFELHQKLETLEIDVLRKPFELESIVQICRQKMGLPVDQFELGPVEA